MARLGRTSAPHAHASRVRRVVADQPTSGRVASGSIDWSGHVTGIDTGSLSGEFRMPVLDWEFARLSTGRQGRQLTKSR
jgi:hypothetical protein